MIDKRLVEMAARVMDLPARETKDIVSFSQNRKQAGWWTNLQIVDFCAEYLDGIAQTIYETEGEDALERYRPKLNRMKQAVLDWRG